MLQLETDVQTITEENENTLMYMNKMQNESNPSFTHGAQSSIAYQRLH